MHEFIVYSLVLTMIINAVVVGVVMTQSWKNVANRYFIAAAFFLIFWALGVIMLSVGPSDSWVEWGRVYFMVAPMYTVLFLGLFAAIFPNKRGNPFNAVNIILALMTVPLSMFVILEPQLFMPIATHSSVGGYNDIRVHTAWYLLFVVYFVIAFTIAYTQLYIRMRKAHGLAKKQLLYVFTGTFAVAIFSLVTNLILPVMGNTQYLWLGPIWSLFYVGAVSVSVAKHRLFDIKPAIVRSIAYAGSLLTLSLLYYIMAYVVSLLLTGADSTRSLVASPVNVLLALVLAFLFQPIKRFFDKYTDKIFYKNEYSPDVFYAELNKLLVSTTDLRSLLQRISQLLEDTFKADQVMFMVYFDKEKTRYMTAGTKVRSDIPRSDARMLDVCMNTNDDRIIVTDSLTEGDIDIRRMLVSHRVALTIPIGIDHSISGYLMLGDRKSGVYNTKDLKVLNTIINELAIAIQNVVSIHAVKKLNATLQQRIEVATKELQSSNAQLKRLDSVKDEFMSMASHQLRTPLTSIKGYLSMVLEGDAGKVDARQKKLLLEAFRSSERMVGLIADFLNVSRIQTGRFVLDNQYFDLVETVESEVDDLEMLAESHDIKLRLTIAKNMTAPVYGDENKLQQVIMNFVDNAIYYSKAKSTVVIRITKTTNTVSVRVVDTGIGVPAEEQKRLFNKFFRAKNARKARPDGTGVGLYLARRVVSAHGGQLIFSSKEGKGSTFGFTLPIKEPPVEEPMTKPVQITTKLD